nr:Rha family transcriptional regulator [Halomonas taeanensis]
MPDFAIKPATTSATIEPTISSHEIAEVVEVRHDSVKPTVERLAARDVIEFPSLVEIPTATKPTTEFRIGKRDNYVIVAQLSPEFTARLVDRWQERWGWSWLLFPHW